MKMISFEVKIKIKDVYAYLMYHMYKGSGLLSILVSIVALIMLILGGRNQDSMKAMMLLFIAMLFTIIQPVSLFLKAAQQVTGNPMFRKPITYKFTEEEFITEQGEQSMSVTYENIWKVVARMVYVGRKMFFHTYGRAASADISCEWEQLLHWYHLAFLVS